MASMAGEYKIESRFNSNYSVPARRIVRMLSENARLSVTEIAKRLGLSRPATKERIRKLEIELGMKYTLEMSEQALGFTSPHLINIKFRKQPDYRKIRELLLSSYIPQLALITSGSYEMIVYANSFTTSEYAHWDKSMRILLGEYGVEWKSSEVVHRQLGFFPIRNEAIDRARIEDKYKPMLKLLNDDSRLSFQQLSKVLGMHFNTVKYNYDKLMSMNYVKRPTVTLPLLKNLTFMSFFASYTPVQGYEAASSNARLAFTTDDANPLISRYIICAPLIGSDDFFTMGVFDSHDVAYEADIQYHRGIFTRHNIRMKYADVKEVLVGRLPIRSIDTKKEYAMITWDPKLGRGPRRPAKLPIV